MVFSEKFLITVGFNLQHKYKGVGDLIFFKYITNMDTSVEHF